MDLKAMPRLNAYIALAILFSLSYPLVIDTRGQRTATAALVASQNTDMHTLKDAGLQFELPKGWKAETQENGNVFLSFEEGAGSVTFVMEDDYAGVVEGMKSVLKQKLTELKFDGEPKQDTHNGLVHISESGTGLMEKVKINWSIDVLKASKNVTMLTFGIEEVLQRHIDEYKKFVGSIKKT